MSTANYDTIAANLAGNIRELLDARNMPQSELAASAGVDPMTVSRILSEDQMPKTSTLARLARALRVTTDDLIRTPPQKKSGNLKKRA